jgi:hypothetical protein
MNCPRCAFPDAGGAECPNCGLDFSKLPPSALPRLDTLAVLRETFQTYKDCTPSFTACLSLCTPYFVLTELSSRKGLTSPGWVTTLGVLFVIEHVLLSILLTRGALLHLRGATSPAGETLSAVLRAFPVVLAVWSIKSVVVVLGLGVFVLPGLIAIAAYGIAVPLAIEERPGILASLRQSVQRTTGNRLPVFSVLAAIWIVTLGLEWSFGYFASLLGVKSAFLTSAPPHAISLGLFGAAAAVLHHRLRSSQESIHVQELASVFD